MLHRRLQLSLLALQLVGAATLLRSVAYDRWITVLASVLLLVGATAAQRGKSWGVALAFGAAIAFPVAWLVGIAPAWFGLVGVVGSLPYLLASRAFARFDKTATTLLTLAAASAGALGALAWKEFAWPLFVTFPSLRPSGEAQHGLALLALVASALLAVRLGKDRRAEQVRLRIADHVRVAEPDAAQSPIKIEVAEDAETTNGFEAPERRRAIR